VDIQEAQRLFASQLPEGFSLLKVSRIPLFFPSLESLINRVEYLVKVPVQWIHGMSDQELRASLDQFLQDPSLSLQKVKKGKNSSKLVSIPLKPLLMQMAWIPDSSFQFSGSAEEDRILSLTMKFGPGHHVKPEKVAGLYLHLSDEAARALKVLRKTFYIEQNGSAVEP
jgi:hypothetical protein